MARLTRYTSLQEVLQGSRGVLPLFEARGVRTLGDLERLSLADWWRSARTSFQALVDAAARARVAPSSRLDIGPLRQRDFAHNLTHGLKMTEDAKLVAIADALAAAGVTSLMLVSQLRPRDLRSVAGVGDSEVKLLQVWLRATGIELPR